MIRLLIVEDDDSLRLALHRMLSHAGYDVTTARGVRQALVLYNRHPVDVVVCDLLLPDKDGVELVMEIGRLQPRPRFIAMTEGGRIPAAVHLRIAEHHGVVRVLTKPFQAEQLLTAIDEALADG